MSRILAVAGSLLALSGCLSSADPSEKFACQWQPVSIETPKSRIQVSPDLYDQGMAAALSALVRNISEGGAGPYFAGNFYAVPGMDAGILRQLERTEEFVDGGWGTHKIPRPTLTDLSCDATISVTRREVDNPACIKELSTFLKEGHRYFGHRNAAMTKIHHIYRFAFTRSDTIDWRYLSEKLPATFNYPNAVFSFLNSDLTVINEEGNTIVKTGGIFRNLDGSYQIARRTLDNGITVEGAVAGNKSHLMAVGSFGRLRATGKCKRIQG
jgi:hypothetical protein